MPLLALQAAQPRLNRSEYAYSVRDLLGIDLDAAADLPKDDSGYGFDNIADALSVSPLLMEQYLKAAERAAHVAVFGPDTVRPAVERFQAPRRGPAVLAPGSLDPTGLSLTDSVHKRYVFPAAGEYRITAFLDGKSPQALEVGFWLDGRQMASAKVDGGIEVDRRVEGRMQVARRARPSALRRPARRQLDRPPAPVCARGRRDRVVRSRSARARLRRAPRPGGAGVRRHRRRHRARPPAGAGGVRIVARLHHADQAADHDAPPAHRLLRHGRGRARAARMGRRRLGHGRARTRLRRRQRDQPRARPRHRPADGR